MWHHLHRSGLGPGWFKFCHLCVCVCAAMACFCFLPNCVVCRGGEEPKPASTQVDHPTARQDDHNSSVECSCFLPDCPACATGPALKPLEGIVAAGSPEGIVASGDSMPPEGNAASGGTSRARKRKRRAPPPGHVKCSLAQELEKDQEIDLVTFDARVAALASAGILLLQPCLSALELIGRPRGERWDFWEIYAGCGNLSAAVLALGLSVGPPVDVLQKQGGLALDCLLQNSQALLQAVLEEARPRWLHVAPPCTFWTAIGRWTAYRTPEQWAALREKAIGHWYFALHLLVLQQRRGAKGSVEQPTRCASWKLRISQQFYTENPEWEHFHWPSCAYGMRDPVTGAPWNKTQGFLSNASLAPMRRKCTCWPVRHGIVLGVIKSGPRRGERRSAISGEYPVRMCEALATVVQQAVQVLS